MIAIEGMEFFAYHGCFAEEQHIKILEEMNDIIYTDSEDDFSSMGLFSLLASCVASVSDRNR